MLGKLLNCLASISGSTNTFLLPGPQSPHLYGTMMVYAADKISGLSWELNQLIHGKCLKQRWVLIMLSCCDGKGPGGTEWAAGGSELSLGKSFPSQWRKALRGFRLKGWSSLSHSVASQELSSLPSWAKCPEKSAFVSGIVGPLHEGLGAGSNKSLASRSSCLFSMDLFDPSPFWSTFFFFSH